MAISNYNELKTAIASWLHRDDLTSVIPDFITLAESRINRELSPRVSETDTTITASIGSRYIALPSGFGKVYGVWLTTYLPRKKLLYRTPEELVVTNSNSLPQEYTIDGSNLAFNCPADKAYTFTLRYKTKLDIQNTSTNYILTNYPDVYLYASLVEAAIYTRNTQGINDWKGFYDIAMDAVIHNETSHRHLVTLTANTGGLLSKTNIIDGDY